MIYQTILPIRFICVGRCFFQMNGRLLKAKDAQHREESVNTAEEEVQRQIWSNGYIVNEALYASR